MESQASRAKKTLFDRDDVATENVKFCLGTDRDVTPEQLAEQLNRADAQIRSGTTEKSRSLDGHLKTLKA